MLTIGSLFSGVGGLELGLESIGLGPTLWQAECDSYCRAVLARYWPEALRFERVEDIDEHAPRVDIMSGERVGLDSARSGLWSEFVRCIRVLGPRLVFVENVPELATCLGRVLGPLAELGFDAEWGVFSAADVGAPHIRRRMFVLAFLPDTVCGGLVVARQSLAFARRDLSPVARDDGGAGTLADTDGGRRPHEGGQRPALGGWWEAEPDVGRVVDGPASRLDRRRRRARLRCLGNGVVPQQAAHAFLSLAQRAGLLRRAA